MREVCELSIGKILKLVFLLALFFAATTSAALAASLSISPNTGVYTLGNTFSTRVLVNTGGSSVNAADGTIKFNPAELSVVSLSKGSIFNLWTAEPTFSNTAGTISFSGGNPTGYNGSNGTVLTVTFRAKTAGTAKVNFTNGSVLAADGRGTNVLTAMNGGSYTIAAASTVPEPEVIEYVAPANTPAKPSITSETHPNPEKFYNVTAAKLSWTLPVGVTSVRTLLDGNSGSVPTKVYDNPISSITLEDLEDGVQYFHLQFKNADGWGQVAHYRLAIDTEKPSKFDIVLTDNADLSNPVQTLKFVVSDETSQVKRFLVQLDGADPYEYIDEAGDQTHTLAALEPGYHSVIVEAFDEADNSLISTFSFSILAFDKPQFTEYPSEINEEVIPVIKGITRPNAEVEISLTRLGSDTQTKTVRSDETGEFIFIPDGRLSLGVYELSAVAIDQHGAKSEPADKIRIAVQQPGYIAIGSLLVSVLSIVVPLLALVVLLLLIVGYFVRRLRLIVGGVRRESKEALVILQTEFEEILSELKKQEATLRASRKTAKLTKAEADLIKAMELQIVDSRKRVAKEVGDVEEIVD